MKHIKCYIAILSMLFFLTAICITSCTEDYGPEIDKIKTDVSNLQTSVDKLKEAYEGAKIVTAVSPISTNWGGWKITFSDESTIFIQNGADGKDGVNGKDAVDRNDNADGVTPYVKIDNNCNWVISYDNGTTFSPILDANGNVISSEGVSGNNGVSLDVRLNDVGNYEIITYREDINNPIAVLTTPYNNNPANKIASIVEDSESGLITITMADGERYSFGQAINYPASIVILTDEIVIDELEGTAEIEFRINPSNAKITKNNIVIDQIDLTEELRSFAKPTPNYDIVSLVRSVNSAGEETEGQYKLTIKHKGPVGSYRETCTMIISTKDAQGNNIEISSEKFYLISDIENICYYTVNLNSQWRKSSNVSNPNSTLYDGVYESYSNYNVHNSTATMTITISGYTTFTLYVRSNAESTYDYVTVSQLDNSSSNKYSTSGKQTSGTSLSSYTAVTFSGIGGGTHTITIKYRKDGSVSNGTDRGYVLIPKNQ